MTIRNPISAFRLRVHFQHLPSLSASLPSPLHAALPTGIVVAALFVVSGCGAHTENRLNQAPALPAASVRAQTVQLKSQATFEEVVGTVRAKLRATLEAKVTGGIQQMPVVLGQTVKAGDLIVRLSVPELHARLEQTHALLQQTEKDWKRISALFEQQALTRAEYDAADSKFQLARASVGEAQAMAGYAEVHAPFNGIITQKSADIGDLAGPGKPLVDLEDPTALQLEADVPETIVSRLHRDARLIVHIDGPEHELSGTLTEISPSADPQSRTFRVKLDLPNGSGLMPGGFARLMVPLGQNDSMFVPASAVVQRGQLEIAFVVSKQRAEMHLVRTGKRVGDKLEILSGLDAGDSLVVEGTSNLVDGQPVTLK